MNWMDGCRYKILGHKIFYKGETLYVFELGECEIFRARPKRTNAEREARVKSMTPEQLAEAENTFVLPVSQHQNVMQLETMDQYKVITSVRSDAGGSGL